MSRWSTIAIAVQAALLLVVAGCGDWPRDPRGTLERVRGGTLRVGVSVSPPWTSAGGPGEGTPGGVEASAVEALASRLGATVAWRVDGEETLLSDLEQHRLDLVVGGLTMSNPWATRVAFTTPFVTTEHEGATASHVWAVPRGENGWLVTVERFLYDEREALRASAALAGERVR